MAFINTNHASTDLFASVAAGGRRVLRGIGRGVIAVMEAKSRSRQIERLTSMNDAQLADIGLKREDIVYHVFSDRLYY